jgi:hypothetical protein
MTVWSQQLCMFESCASLVARRRLVASGVLWRRSPFCPTVVHSCWLTFGHGSVQGGIMFHHELCFVRDQAYILPQENPSIYMKADVLTPMFR